MSSLSRVFSVLLMGLCAAGAAVPAVQVGFNDLTISKVEANTLAIASRSWELGTACEALTELLAPRLSVFNAAALPPPKTLDPHVVGNTTALLAIATSVVQSKPFNSTTLIASDGAVGDPASLGVAVLLANWTRTNHSDTSFAAAATQQLQYLIQGAPRTADGAISHRADNVSLWADFIYMAPPFIAYYGALEGGSTGTSLLQLAFDQCRLYRNYLRDDNGLWRHTVLGDYQDAHHWGTGNAWAAAGMLRVLETISHSGQAKQFQSQRANLTSWVHEIINGTWQFQQPNGTLLNVIDDPNSFADSSSTALLAAATYRYMMLTGDLSLLAPANRALNVIRQSVDINGWLLQVVDPISFYQPLAPGQASPEGQAFVLLLHAAWRDFRAWANTLVH